MTLLKDQILPRSDAQNGYELLQDVIQCVKEEPKRLYMNFTILKGEPGSIGGRVQYPSCGTVGCVAGWTVLLAPIKDPFSHRMRLALDILLPKDHITRTRQARQDLADIFSTFPKHPHGSQKYVNSIVSKLKAFIKKYKDLLQNQTLTKEFFKELEAKYY